MIKFLIGIGGLFLNGFVLKILYDWYLRVIFELPDITIFHAIGISFLASLLTHQYISRDKEEEAKVLVVSILWPIITLLFGWIFHFFV